MVSGILQNGTVAGIERPLLPRSREPASQTAASANAVVPVAPAAIVPAHTARVRPDTSFLMQLLATSADAPQTRKFRQTDPAQGTARYQSAQAVLAGPRRKSGYSQVV